MYFAHLLKQNPDARSGKEDTMSKDIEAELTAIKAQAQERGDAKAWSLLWVLSAIEITAIISQNTTLAYLALGAMREPAVRGIAPSVTRDLSRLVEGDDVTEIVPFMSPRSDETNALICAVSAYVLILIMIEEGRDGAHRVMREAYDAVISVKRPASKRIIGWLQAESKRRDLDWPPPREKSDRDYKALCAELV